MDDTTTGTLEPNERARVRWHISTYSPNGGGNCVEAGPLNDGTDRVAVRHSHHPNAELIVYTRGEWEAFTAGVRNGEFDFFA
ncbi:DUF397 domain-containing protein [Actinomadura atramentaria]|uniref:DUF397 domain-containing protein n=1 Tax=Actinomadura atramentaria TaxID=1990 RepID=UPI00036ABB3C|nr:DUF397 domain-containing protein [Actinomadura atramentaria]